MRMLSNSGTSRGLTAKRFGVPTGLCPHGESVEQGGVLNKGSARSRTSLSLSAVAGLTAIAVLALCATSCNVTRTVTNESKYITRGDTSVVITTKTIESYDGTRK